MLEPGSRIQKFCESWEIVPVFSDILNPGTKFQNDTLARGSESWNLKNMERGHIHSSFLTRANSDKKCLNFFELGVLYHLDRGVNSIFPTKLCREIRNYKT
jgi:hypothetical protein